MAGVNRVAASRTIGQEPQPGGAGPTRDRFIMPDAPALLPAVKLKLSCAVPQLKKVAVAMPTVCVLTVNAGSGLPPITPPVVS